MTSSASDPRIIDIDITGESAPYHTKEAIDNQHICEDLPSLYIP